MGLRMHGLSHCYDDPKATPNPNPDPGVFKIIRTEQFGKHLVAEILYPGVTTFEGRKILLYLNVWDSELRLQRRLDPHFCAGKHIAPFARFRPDDEGWTAAVLTAMLMR